MSWCQYLSWSPPNFPFIFGCSSVECIYFYNVYIVLLNSSHEYYEVSFWVSFYGPCFEVYFVWYEHCTPAFSPCPFAGNIFFQLFTLILYRSFVLSWVSWRQHMYQPLFLIHSAMLCHFIAAFNPLCLGLLLIGTCSLPFYFPCTCVPLSLTLFLPFLKAVPLSYLAVGLGGSAIFEHSFFWKGPYFAFILIENLAG